MTKIAIVGATGPTGRHFVQQALQRGHEVVAYVRRPGALEPQPRLTVVGGELPDIDRFAEAIRDCTVLVCTLGTRSRAERGFMTRHLPLVTSAMKQGNVPRLVLMSALGGGEVPTHVRGIGRLVFLLLSRVVFADRTKSEAALAETGLTWSAVYPGFLTDAAAINACDVIAVDDVVNSKNSRIPRANVASVLLDLVDDARPQRVMVAPPGCLTRRDADSGKA